MPGKALYFERFVLTVDPPAPHPAPSEGHGCGGGGRPPLRSQSVFRPQLDFKLIGNDRNATIAQGNYCWQQQTCIEGCNNAYLVR